MCLTSVFTAIPFDNPLTVTNPKQVLYIQSDVAAPSAGSTVNPRLPFLLPYRYYGDISWYAPDGVDGDKKDTLLIIAVKINNAKLVEWMLSLDGLDTTKQNGKGLNAMAVAKALGRENLLLGMAASEAPPDATESAVKGASTAAGLGAPPPPPPPPSNAAADQAGLEVARLNNAIKMLKVISSLVVSFTIPAARSTLDAECFIDDAKAHRQLNRLFK